MTDAEPLGQPGKRLILVVEDDDSIRELIATAATLEGFLVVTAVNGIDAAGRLEANLPDLIITDLMMSGQGGYEFLRGLQEAGHGRIPVFVVTGSNLDHSTLEVVGREANTVEIFQKPIDMIPFMTAVHARLKTAPPRLRMKSW